MMGRQDRDQRQLFYEFSLDEMIPTDHLLRRINVLATLVIWRAIRLRRNFCHAPSWSRPSRSRITFKPPSGRQGACGLFALLRSGMQAPRFAPTAVNPDLHHRLSIRGVRKTLSADQREI
jgi:hypothetical protein